MSIENDILKVRGLINPKVFYKDNRLSKSIIFTEYKPKGGVSVEQAFNKKQMKYLHDTFVTKEYLDQRLDKLELKLEQKLEEKLEEKLKQRLKPLYDALNIEWI